jgi:alanine dehydrogenase
VALGHRVVVETQAGAAIDLNDEQYAAAGAEIVPDAASREGRKPKSDHAAAP